MRRITWETYKRERDARVAAEAERDRERERAREAEQELTRRSRRDKAKIDAAEAVVEAARKVAAEAEEGENEYIDLRSVLAVFDGLARSGEKCDNCKGGGCLDENGNPTVWGRADSYECQECGGSGLARSGDA